MHLSNWFILYCASRTLSNTLETALTMIALDFFIQGQTIHVLFVALAVIVRPTAVLLWAPIYLVKLYEAKSKIKFILRYFFILYNVY